MEEETILKIQELFKAKISIKYSLSQLFPKDAVSTMFPKNWSLERIKEEVAFVYEKAMKNSDLIKVKATGMNFGKIEGECLGGFKIILYIRKYS